MNSTRALWRLGLGLVLALSLAACGSTATPVPATPPPTLAASPIPVTLDVPATVPAGAEFSVAWTGPNGRGDYVVIVAKGAAKVLDTNFYFNVNTYNPVGTLKAPPLAGDYEIWYVVGDTADNILGRQPITVK